MKPDVKKTITKVTLETLRTPNVCIFFQAVKLYLTIFYDGIPIIIILSAYAVNNSI